MNRTSSPKNKLSQKERRDATREKIASTTFRLLQESGYANLRTAAVSQAAGVSQGGLVHHFPNKDSLVMAAVEIGTERADHRSQACLESFKDGADVLEAVIEESKDYYFGDSFNVALDVIDWGSRDKELLNAMKQRSLSYRKETERAWSEKLIAQGWSRDDAEDVVELTACLVRGFAIRRKANPKSSRRIEELLRRWTRIAPQLKE